MMRGDFLDLTAGGHSGCSQAKQSADLIGRKPQFARAPYEDEGTKLHRAKDATPACGARWRGQHLDPLVIANRLDIHAGESGKTAHGARFGRPERVRERANELWPL